ncbi:HNH endonuclease signature motif containing protein [Nitrosovibrio sp. Nv6]|uniref:HNH endonuclease signature motif containing protein n=1 Tax=Nitrosovibrio sp. Nv6 TaxID=1855340 RepID=UPI0035159C15
MVISEAGRSSDGHLLWECICDCGTKCLVQSNNFRSGERKGTQSCGCLRSEVSSKPKTVWNAGKTYQIHSDEAVFKNRKAWANAVRRTKGSSCTRCGWDKATCDVHHIIPRCKGGLNTVTNGEVICPNCHRIEHEAGK